MNTKMPISNGWAVRLNNKTKLLTDTHLQLFFISLFTLLYLVRDLLGIYFPDIVFSGICGIAFLLLSNGAALGVYIFSTALTVPQNEIMLLYFAVFCLKQFRSGGIRFHRSMFIMVAALMVLQLVDMALFSKSSPASMLYEYITKMLYIVVPMLWCMIEISPYQYRNSMICYMWGALLGGCIVVILTARVIGWNELFTGNQFQRLGVTANAAGTMQSTYNANQLSGMMAITISMALVLMEKKKLSPIIGFPVCGIAMVIVALAKSRTGLLCTGGAIGLYILYTLFVSRKIIRGSIFVIGIVGIVALLLYIEPELFSGLMSRFEEQEDITNGRSDLLLIYLNEWSDNLWSILFGYGIGSFQDVITGIGVPHNSITDILISWGATGFVLVVGILGLLYSESFKKLPAKSKFLASIPFLVALVISMGGQYLTTGFSHTRLCFLLVSMQAIANSGMRKERDFN